MEIVDAHRLTQVLAQYTHIWIAVKLSIIQLTLFAGLICISKSG